MSEHRRSYTFLIATSSARVRRVSIRRKTVYGIASIIGIIVLIVGASGVFVELEDALNTIWKVPPEKSATVWAFLRDRCISFSLVLGTGFLLLVSLVISAVLAALARFLTPPMVPGGLWFWQTLNAVISFAFITLLFALIFK